MATEERGKIHTVFMEKVKKHSKKPEIFYELSEGDGMTDNEIIKALECCISCENCDICPQHSTECVSDLLKLAYDLITCQREDIENLKIENQSLRGAANSYKIHYNEARAEAVKEFAERFLKKVHDNHYLLSDRNNSKDYGMFTVGIEQAVNETKEEMVGDTE